LVKYNISNFEKNIILLLCDTFIIIFSIGLAYTLRLEKIYPLWEIDTIVYLIFFSVFFLVFYLNNVYRILIRYFDYYSIKKLIKSIIYFQIILIIINLFIYKQIYFPRSVSLIAPIFIGIFVILSRLIISFLINSKNIKKNLTNNILIIGINEHTVNLFNNIRQNPNYGAVKCFLDISEEYKKREINGVKIYKSQNLYQIIKSLDIKEIIIGTKGFKKFQKISLFKNLENSNIKIKDLANTKGNYKNLIKKSLEIKPSFYDIINRKKIVVKKEILERKIKNKDILITGAGGSIGSELCLEILKHKPKKLFMLEISEINLFNLINKLKEKKFNFKVIKPILGDCNDKYFLENYFKSKNIDEVYHAAAYKHVNFGEENPYSMIKNNIFATQTIVNFSLMKKIKNFTFISSDKAVEPKSILGITKKFGEKIIQYEYSKNKKKSSTNFTIVRFGNVVGSSGSVIPIFLSQISKDLPLTVTHKKVKRYFMSISEAVQLVINASYMNKRDLRIFVLNMGEQIFIHKIAERIIRLSGKTVKDKKNKNGDISIKITGLKKGEKISEEITLGDNLLSTSHPDIMLCDENINIKTLKYDLSKIQNMSFKDVYKMKL
jgi:FlaA1/EpsC-like NDP-sugar epimerase